MRPNKKAPIVALEQMGEGDLEEAVSLVSAAMNENEAEWAQDAFEFYFACKGRGLDSGREYCVWRRSGKICGLVGLHRYIWGPRENVWLSWFAVHPQEQGRGFGRALIAKIAERAQEQGYKKLLVETYDSPTFDKARSFYGANGFCEWGRIESYLPDGGAMIVFGKEI
jgi:GNAT superfamily N-acetyltransferase